jgi:hypothetical protein
MDGRRDDLVRFYKILDRLEKSIGGERSLAACSSRMDWPKRGVYFFREVGEARSDTGSGPRIVRWHACAQSRFRHEALVALVAAQGAAEHRWR